MPDWFIASAALVGRWCAIYALLMALRDDWPLWIVTCFLFWLVPPSD